MSQQKMGFFIRKSEDTGESVSALMPITEVVAVVVMKAGHILLAYNEKWGAFTLPMTKRRTWEDPSQKADAVREEEWEDAALRAASEWLGSTTKAKPEGLGQVPEFQQSDRDGKWKRYHTEAFRLVVEDSLDSAPGKSTEWLTVEDILDEDRRPISPTARHVMAELQGRGAI